VSEPAPPGTGRASAPGGTQGARGAAAPARRGGTRTAKPPRRRSRELALQGLYEWLVARGETAAIEAHIREMDGFDKCDREHFDTLLHGSVAQAAALDALLARHLDRPLAQLSPVEHAVLMIGAYELVHCVDVPYRVVINEAVELAKTFGGTDGHRYVNGVLDKTAAALRPAEAGAHAR